MNCTEDNEENKGHPEVWTHSDVHRQHQCGKDGQPASGERANYGNAFVTFVTFCAICLLQMITCIKTYADIPFAHRQHRHDGHCRLIHGHNWSITLTFGCRAPDENGFVVDFGKLKYLRDWISANLDHACVFNRDDPLRESLVAVGGAGAWKAYVVESCSCEGLAKHLFDVFDPMVREHTNDRAFLMDVSVIEDSKNSGAYRRDS